MKLLQKYYIGCPRKFQLKFCDPYIFFDVPDIRNINEEIAGISENGSGKGLLVYAGTGFALDTCGGAAGAFAARKARIGIGRYLGREAESPVRMLRARITGVLLYQFCPRYLRQRRRRFRCAKGRI